MSMPSIITQPLVMRAPGMRSLMRLKQRSRVDLPQPDGPMKAVMRLRGITRFTPCRTCLSP